MRSWEGSHWGQEAPQAWKLEEVGPGTVLGPRPTPDYNEGATPREHDIPPFFCLGGVVGSPLTAPSSPEAFEDLKTDPEPGVQEFAAKQFSFLQEVTARPQ